MLNNQVGLARRHNAVVGKDQRDRVVPIRVIENDSILAHLPLLCKNRGQQRLGNAARLLPGVRGRVVPDTASTW